MSGDFGMLDTVMRQDWGNPRQIHFMEKTAGWEPRLVGQTAGGHFRVAIRKSPAERHWSWALEWNKNFRTVGLLGEPEAMNRFVSDLPDLGFREVKNRDGEILRKRREVSLAPEFDTLFAPAEDSCTSA